MLQTGPRPAAPYAPGEVVAGRFVVECVVGSGGAGVVMAARHLTLNKRVALKFLRSDALADEEAVDRFLREARATALLKSEHVARVMDAEAVSPSVAFIAMEYLEGRDLAQVLQQDGPLSMEDAVDYLLQACEAIAEAHARDIVHRDIKPSNLFLTRAADGSPFIKVLDFGLSKVGWANAAITSENQVMGSPHFMSPEQMRSSHDVDARSDVWSLGAVLFKLLSGRCPFGGDYFMEICAAVLSGASVSLRTLRPEVPERLEAVIERCLALEPEDRFQTVAELAAALRPFAPAHAVYRVGRVLRISESVLAAPPVADKPAPPDAAPGASGSTPTLVDVGAARDSADAQRRQRSSAILIGALIALAAGGAAAVGAIGWPRSRPVHLGSSGGAAAARAAARLAPTGVATTEPPKDTVQPAPAADPPAEAASATPFAAPPFAGTSPSRQAGASRSPSTGKAPRPARPASSDLFSDAK